MRLVPYLLSRRLKIEQSITLSHRDDRRKDGQRTRDSDSSQCEVDSLILYKDEDELGAVEAVLPPVFGGFVQSEDKQQGAVCERDSPRKHD